MSASRHPVRLLPARLLLGLGLLTLAGCQSLGVAPASPPVLPPAAAANTLTTWSADGKVSLRYLGQSVSATYRWTRQGNDYDAEAAGALDQGHTHVFSRQGLVTLENAWLGRHQSYDPEQMTLALTGIALPLQNLNAWLTGWPALADTPLLPPADGAVREFSEAGWDVRVLAEQNVSGYRLPLRMSISNNSDRLLLSIAHWQPAAATAPSP